MKIQTRELTYAALDWAVLVALHGKHDASNPDHVAHFKRLRSGHPLHRQGNYSTNWSQAGPIIDRERITLDGNAIAGQWLSVLYVPDEEPWEVRGPTPLIAAMRCYVASKLGDEVDVPDEILEDSESLNFENLGDRPRVGG